MIVISDLLVIISDYISEYLFTLSKLNTLLSVFLKMYL